MIGHFLPLGHRPEGHNLCQRLKAGADLDIFVVVRHWQACEVSTVAMVDQGIGDKEFFIGKDADFAGVSGATFWPFRSIFHGYLWTLNNPAAHAQIFVDNHFPHRRPCYVRRQASKWTFFGSLRIPVAIRPTAATVHFFAFGLQSRQSSGPSHP